MDELRAWEHDQRRGDDEADVQEVSARVGMRVGDRLRAHLMRGDTERAVALGVAAGVPGTPHRDLDVACRLVRARAEIGAGRAGLDVDLFLLTEADLRRAGRARETGAWAEYSGVAELRRGIPIRTVDITRWMRCAWAAASEPDLLADVGDGPVRWPHRMLPVPHAGVEAFCDRVAGMRAFAGWRLAVDHDTQGHDCGVWLLGTLAGWVRGRPEAISAAVHCGSIPRSLMLGEMARDALALARRGAHGDLVPPATAPDDVLRCSATRGWVSMLPQPMPGGDLLPQLSSCAHPHPAWVENAHRDALQLSCPDCRATALAVVPLHQVGAVAIDAEHQLRRERFYAHLSGIRPPDDATALVTGAPRASLDIDRALGRDALGAGSLADALFGA